MTCGSRPPASKPRWESSRAETSGTHRRGIMNLPQPVDLPARDREVLGHPEPAELLHLHVIEQHRLSVAVQSGEENDLPHQRCESRKRGDK